MAAMLWMFYVELNLLQLPLLILAQMDNTVPEIVNNLILANYVMNFLGAIIYYGNVHRPVDAENKLYKSLLINAFTSIATGLIALGHFWPYITDEHSPMQEPSRRHRLPNRRWP